VLELAADVSHADQVERLFQEIESAGARLAGIFHAAAVLKDGMLAQMTSDGYRQVFAPKAQAAWHLHRQALARRWSLDYFVLFSSIAAPIGNPGQGNYVAANSYLDQLAHYRNALGLAGTSIQWGALSEVGLAARNAEAIDYFARVGIRMLSPELALRALEEILRHPSAEAGVFDLDWQRFGQDDPRFDRLRQTAVGEASPAQQLRGTLGELSGPERIKAVGKLVAEMIASTLKLPAERIDHNVPLTDLGLDSIVTVELQVGLRPRFGVDISVLELMRAAGVEALAVELCRRMGLASE